ncbi:lysostaphin resistance A-like protein [Clostridium sp.]|uniref:CPBP family intramembrane glutamic endopeptidase n=1 Tax=Clostridium sp. TaxID=1506 RepID=UPI003F408D9D
MYTLYKKNESWFAVLSIIIFVVGSSIADSLSKSVGIAKSITSLFHLVLFAIIFLFIKKNNLFQYYGLCKSNLPAKKVLYYFPLVIIASVNLWFGVKMNFTPIETLFFILSMLLVGFLEEVIFRGFLFKAMCKDNVKTAIIVSSLTFGIGHIVNLFNGSGAELIPNLCQVGYAIAIGFMFVMLFYRGKSLWPCIITHSVLNSLGAFSNTEMAETYRIPVAIILIVVSLGYGLFLIKRTPNP